MLKYPPSLLRLMGILRRFPGVGSRTAERFAFHLLNWPDHQLAELAETVLTVKEKIYTCPECHCLMEEKNCTFCHLDKRDTHHLCVIASAKDAFAIEETGVFRGLYHALGGLLSPLDGRHPHHLFFEDLKRRIETLHVQEIIIALDSTLEGDTTALYLRELLQSSNIKISRLAFGLPMGSSLEFVDGGTLSRALSGRQGF